MNNPYVTLNKSKQKLRAQKIITDTPSAARLSRPQSFLPTRTVEIYQIAKADVTLQDIDTDIEVVTLVDLVTLIRNMENNTLP